MRKKLVAITGLLFAVNAQAATIELSEHNTLSITTDKKGITTVAIVDSGSLVESVSIGNSSFDVAAIRNERLCQGCEKAYVIPIPDATSTWGAQSFVVVYPEGQGFWSMQKLPITFDLEKAPKANHFQLKAEDGRFEFRDGLLTRIK